MKPIIEKILEDVDSDIRHLMLRDSDMIRLGLPTDTGPEYFYNWELIPHPLETILMWQELRDRKKTITT